MNRAERRAQEHGRDKGDHVQDNLRTQAQNQGDSAMGPEEAAAQEEGEGLHESVAANGTRMINAGSGGAIESDGRLPHHEGMHLPNVPNA